MKVSCTYKVIFTLFLWAVFTCLHADEKLRFERIDNRNGLSSDFINGVLQDKEGYMWFASIDGLNRFDGYDIKTYKTRENGEIYFSSNEFECIEEDNQGNLWLGTIQNGVNIFNKKTGEVRFITTDTLNGLAVPDNQIQDIHCDSLGNVWISTYNGICRYNVDKGTIQSFLPDINNPLNIPSGNVHCIYETPGGNLFFGASGKGLYQYNFDSGTFTHYSFSMANTFQDRNIGFLSLLEDKHGILWIGTWQGLLKTRLKNGEIHILESFNTSTDNSGDELLNNIIFDIEELPNGDLWIATAQGLSILSNNLTEPHTMLTILEGEENNLLSNCEIYDMEQDASGSIWLATKGGGMNKVDLNSYSFDLFKIPIIDPAFRSQNVNCIYPINSKEILLGIRSIGMGVFNLESKKISNSKDHPYFNGTPRGINSVYSALRDSKGNLWLGTRYRGLLRKDIHTNHWEVIVRGNYFKDKTSHSVNCIIEDKNNNLWVGTTDGLLKLVPSSSSNGYAIFPFAPIVNNPNSLGGKNITRLLIDSGETLWVATQDGGISKLENCLDKFMPIEFHTENIENSGLKTNNINTIVEDVKGKIWIGTATRGIVQYENSQYKNYDHVLHLIGNTIYDIIPDEMGAMWLTTNKGLVRLAVEGEETNIQNFTSEDGLQGNIFNRGSFYKNENGDIYLGGIYGFNRFSPNSFQQNSYIPPVVLTNIQINNKPIDIGRIQNNQLVLSLKENNISAGFSALSYSQSKKNKFSFLLEGFVDDWVTTDHNNRKAVYTNIPPGKYTLKVKASNNSWVWNPNPKTLDIIVKPSPYLSTLAIIIYILIFMGVLYLFYWFKLNNIRIKQAFEIEKIERKEEEKLHQFKLRFFTNVSHELLTPLSIISCAIDDFFGKKEINHRNLHAVSRNVSKLMVLINQLLEFRKIETGKMELNVGLSTLQDMFFKMEEAYKPLAQNKKLDYIVKGDIKKPVYCDIDKIETITTNLLSNAFKYTEEGGFIGIYYSLIEDNKKQFLEIKVSDSGLGITESEMPHIFERFYQVDSPKDEKNGAGIGLSVVKNLVDLHMGTISVESKKGKGTSFTVKIPVEKEMYENLEIDEIEKGGTCIKSIKIILDDEAYFQEPTNKLQQTNDFSILVVEDNHEFRNLLVNHLSNYYKIYEAPDGLQGYEMAGKLNPDLIISDVMMPKMDGFEFCKKLKENIELSHILFVLLTAKGTNEDKYEGYLCGADSYISKPLNFKLLKARIESLKKQREIIKEKYSNNILPNSHPEELSSVNREFIEQVIGYIKEDISNPGFNVTMLLSKIHISHSSLYRKTQSLTGMSPNEFIRHVRINEAAQMLLKSGLSVSEVAYAVGFNDQSYFSRCFKKQYNKNPKQYIKEHLKVH